MLEFLVTSFAHGLRLALALAAAACREAPQPTELQERLAAPQAPEVRLEPLEHGRGIPWRLSGPQAAPLRRGEGAPSTSIAGQVEDPTDPQADFYGFLYSAGSQVHDRQSVSVTILPSSYLPGPNTSILAEVVLMPPSGFVESFLVLVPSPLPSTPQPMLVVFHKFGASHFDAQQNTQFLEEANSRGWFVMAPLGASKKHFSALESQINTEWAFNWVLAAWGSRIDRERIYGVGFSMGGGAVTNYAARHLDPTQPMFAALVDHAGGVALNNTYYHEIPAAKAILDFWFGNGAPGSADPWKMDRSSVIDFDPITLVTSSDDDLARNLMHIPLKITRAWIDPIAYINDQCDAFDQHMRGLGKVVGPDYSYEFVPRGQQITAHTWDILPFGEVCDWLSAHKLQLPSEARTLADRDARYFHFYVQQDASGAFTPFDWKVDGAGNALHFTGTANLARATLDPLEAGLDPMSAMAVVVGSADGNPDRITLTGIAAQPSSVLLDGSANTLNWTYDPVSHMLDLTAPDGGAHTWQVWP